LIDIINVSDERKILLVGDFSGKGINASMSILILKSVIRTLIKETITLQSLIIKINKIIKKNLSRETYFSGVFVLVDTKINRFQYVNCGIPLMYFYKHKSNTLEEIQGPGKVLGFVENYEEHINVIEKDFSSEDIVFMTTDGIFNSPSINGASYTDDRLKSQIIKEKNKYSNEIVNTIYDDFLEFTSNIISDDITLAAVKINKSRKNI